MSARTVLLTGATGFVGRHLRPALEASGRIVRSASRRPSQARARWGDATWVAMDLADCGSIARALQGCDEAVYLAHELEGAGDYGSREAASAMRFLRAAESTKLRRLVYLGGVIPTGPRSPHLESRFRTGAILRGGKVSTIELRAAMIVGHGSASFTLVRDLVVRLPALLLPSWLEQPSRPIAIDDVVAALLDALDLGRTDSACFDLPGPECITHLAFIERVARLVGTRCASRQLRALTPYRAGRLLERLSSVPVPVTRELVRGLDCNLTSTLTSFWDVSGTSPLRPLGLAILDALKDETDPARPSSATRRRIVERTLARSVPSGAVP